MYAFILLKKEELYLNNTYHDFHLVFVMTLNSTAMMEAALKLVNFTKSLRFIRFIYQSL